MAKTQGIALRGFNYKVFIEGKQVSFSKVSGIMGQSTIEEIEEGGRNNTTYRRKIKERIEGELKLERMITFGGKAAGGYEAGQILSKEVEVYIMDSKGSLQTAYFFIGCTIKDISYNDLDAAQSTMLLETLTITYQNIDISY